MYFMVGLLDHKLLTAGLLSYFIKSNVSMYTMHKASTWNEMFDNSGSNYFFQIDQKVEKDWPFYMIDHSGKSHEVILKPGQMVLYENGLVPHGRQMELEGDYYDNLFVRYSLFKE